MSKEKKNFEQERFEFMFRINGHPICQRFFDIRNYTTDYDAKEMIDSITGLNNGNFGSLGIIPKFLQDKTREYLWNFYNPYSEERESTYVKKDSNEKEDIFTFEFRVDGRTVVESFFSGNIFPPKVRYQVNIKDIIHNIITEIRNHTSSFIKD